MFEKLEAILKRFEELTTLVSDPEVVKRREEWQNLVKERASLEEVAEKLNVARQTVSKWELGETTPEMDKLIKMSEIFNITLDELIKDKNNDENINNTNSQKLAGLVIKILKGLGIFLIVIAIAVVFLMIISFVSFNKIGTDEGSETNVVEIQEDNEVQFEE